LGGFQTEKERIAVIDLGSNTIHMSVYDRTGDTLQPILSTREFVGLINYTAKGLLTDDGVSRIAETVRAFIGTADAVGVVSLHCFATAGLRNIRNSDEVMGEVAKRTGLHIHIISGKEEARLDFLGAKRPEGLRRGLVVDMGGGSTEIVRYEGEKIRDSLSLPFGSLFLYKRFVSEILPGKSEMKKIRGFVRKQLSVLEWLPGSAENICLIGGTARAVGRIHRELYGRDAEELQGYTFPSGELLELSARLGEKKKAAVRDILRVAPERIHTMLPGLVTFSELARATGCREFSISRNGVREGFLRAHIAGRAGREDDAPSENG
jgi:exopolyphosphatase/guanosine-5'-triphosphate,3'-diphosphate pyrophosphatase